MRKRRNVVIGTALLAGMLACPDRPGQPRTGEGGREGSTANKAADRPDDRGATVPRNAETGTGSATPGGAGSGGTSTPGATGDSQSAGTTRNTGSSGGTGSGSGGSGSTGSESSGTR